MLKITDHALLRWLERFESLDVLSTIRDMRVSGWTDATESGVLRYLEAVHGVSLEAARLRALQAITGSAPVSIGHRRFRVGHVVFAFLGREGRGSILTFMPATASAGA